MNQEEQLRYVTAWLASVFGGENAPTLVNIREKSISNLYKLAKSIEEKQQNTEILIQNYNDRTDEYRLEGKRLGEVLDLCGLSMNSLSTEAQHYLKTTSAIAVQLDSKNCRMSSLLASMSTLQSSRESIMQRLTEETKNVKSLEQATKRALTELHDSKILLQRFKEESEQNQIKLRTVREVENLWQKKKEQYKQQHVSLGEELAQSGVNTETTHNALCKFHAETEEIQNKTKPFMTKCDSYNQLPPDSALAQLRVEKTREKLIELESKFNQGIQNF